MFWSNYPVAGLSHRRILRVKGADRGLAVFSPTSDSTEETKYDNSTMIMSSIPGVVYVMEWTGQDVEQHWIDL